jgi:iron complex outermembrane recepter protein
MTTRCIQVARLGALPLIALMFEVSYAQPSAEPAEAAARVGSHRVIEEVITTARRRTESLQSVPVSAYGVSREDIERNSLTDLQKIATAVPNLQISRGTSGSGPTLHIRGVGTSGGSGGFDPAVSIVIDGVAYTRGRWVQQGYLDLQQVEVLKGPQALYFGKNNSAGVIAMTTADPGPEFEAYVRAGYEIEENEQLLETVISGPLSETFGARLALRYLDSEGYVKNQARPIVGQDPLGFVIPGASSRRLPAETDYNGRLTLMWTPTEALQAKLKIAGARNTDSSRYSTLQQTECFGPNGTPQPIFGVNSSDDDCRLNFTQALADLPDELMAGEPSYFKKNGGQQWSEYESRSATMQIDYAADRFDLTSISAFTKYDNAYMGNSEFTAQGQVGVYENQVYESLSQEFRVLTRLDGPVNFLVGVYYQEVDFLFRNSARIAAVPADPVTGRFWSYEKDSTTDGQTKSAFAEVTWNITDTVELTGGARYTEEKKDSDLQSTYVHSLLSGFLSERNLFNKFKDDNVSPQTTLSWRPQDNMTFFVAYREGFKSGGFDSSFLLTNATAERADLTFRSETSEGFEAGAKMMLFDRRLLLNATAYRYEFVDLQRQELDTETTQFRIRNAGEARTTGLEVDFRWLASASLSLQGSVGYNKGEYADFLVGCYSGQSIEQGCDRVLNPANGRFTSQDRTGKPLIKAPEWSAVLGFDYDVALAQGWAVAFSGDASYTDDHLLDEKDIPGTQQPAFTLFNAAATLRDPTDRWELALIGRNLGDKAYAFTALGRPLTGGSSGLPLGTPGQTRSDVTKGVQRGRQILFRLTYRFR